MTKAVAPTKSRSVTELGPAVIKAVQQQVSTQFLARDGSGMMADLMPLAVNATGAVIIARAIDRLTDAVNKNTAAIRETDMHVRHVDADGTEVELTRRLDFNTEFAKAMDRSKATPRRKS